jgi:hypothetical protein
MSEPVPSLRSLQARPLGLLYSVAVVMLVFWYFGRVPFYQDHLSGLLPATRFTPIYSFLYFATSSVVLRLVVPILLILLVFRRPLREFGFSFRGTFEVWWVYLALFLAVVPVVWLVGHTAAFQAKYPLCREMIREGAVPLWLFLTYQGLYLLVFVSGEAFWRGYMVFGLKPYLGLYSIPVMVIPYAMGHFGKPWPEAFGAIATGTVLGYLALRHGNFWLGVATHWGVALVMDLTAIHFRGVVFT